MYLKMDPLTMVGLEQDSIYTIDIDDDLTDFDNLTQAMDFLTKVDLDSIDEYLSLFVMVQDETDQDSVDMVLILAIEKGDN